MFLELLPEWLHEPLAWMTVVIAVGGTTAVARHWVKVFLATRSPDESGLDVD